MTRVNLGDLRLRLKGSGRNPRVIARVVLGVLVLANLVAAALVLRPWSGSTEDLERQAASLREQVRQREIALGRLRTIVNKVRTARSDGDHFTSEYLLSSRTLSSNLALELERMAQKAGVKQKEVTFAFEPIEGSDTLTKATINASYEGSYADLMQFMNVLDRSPRLLIIESLAASPQTSGQLLNVSMRVNAFIQEGAGVPAVVESEQSGEKLAQQTPAAQQPAAAAIPRRPTGTAVDPAAASRFHMSPPSPPAASATPAQAPRQIAPVRAETAVPAPGAPPPPPAERVAAPGPGSLPFALQPRPMRGAPAKGVER